MKKAREELCEIGHRIWQQGLSPGTGGNISTRMENEIIITPTLTGMGFMRPEDLCTLDLDGNVIDCKTRPSSEYKLHLRVYKRRPDVKAVIHGHPPFASAFAVTGETLNTRIQPETVVFLQEVPFVEYGTPSTDELPNNLDRYLAKNRKTYLLQNHGVLCIGEDLIWAYNYLETLENLAKINVTSKLLGGEIEIEKEYLQKLVELFNVDLEI